MLSLSFHQWKTPKRVKDKYKKGIIVTSEQRKSTTNEFEELFVIKTSCGLGLKTQNLAVWYENLEQKMWRTETNSEVT